MDVMKLEVKGDRILVKQMPYENKVGAFYIPQSVVDRKSKRRADAWKAEVISLGDKVYFEKGHHKFTKGSIVYCAPISLDCPAFENEKGDKFMIVTQDDLLAVEVK